jgi:DNA damage-binding protein 1
MLALPTLVEATRTDLGVDVQARDLLIVRMGSVDYLLVGLGDGTLLSYELNDLSFGGSGSGSGSGSGGGGSGHDDGLFGCARRVMLGTRPIRLSIFHTDEGRNTRVFVSCDRPTVVYSRNNKLHFSVVNIPEVGCMVPLSSEVFPDCLAMATETDLMIGTVDSIQEVHIKKQHFGYDLRRIAHHPQAGLYVVLAERVESTGQGEIVKRFVLFLDDCSFEEVHCHKLEPQETGLSICVAPLKVFNSDGEVEKPDASLGHGAGADDGSGGQMEMDCVAVGTAMVVEGEWEPRQGAVHLFRVSVTDGVKRVVVSPARLTVNGAVFSIAAVESRLVAAIGSTVHMLHLDSSSTGHTSEPTLKSECHMDGHINALYLKARGDLILMGDMMRSMTLLKYVPRVAAVAGAEGTGTRAKLEMVSRDYNAHNMRAVGFVDEEFVVGAEDYGTRDPHKIPHTYCVLPFPFWWNMRDPDFPLSLSDPLTGNVIVMRRAVDSTTDDDAQLKDVAEFHLGDYPNVFVKGSLNSQPAEQGGAAGAPDGLNFGTGGTTGTTSLGASMALGADSSGAGSRRFTSTLFGTVSGAIGVIMHIDKNSFRFYNALEICIKQALPTIGGLPHK